MTTLLTPPTGEHEDAPAAVDVAAAQRSPGSPPRRRRRARHHTVYEVILIGIVAYAAAALLNAGALDRRAEEQEFGTRRDLLVTLTGALERIAAAASLDRPLAAFTEDDRDDGEARTNLIAAAAADAEPGTVASFERTAPAPAAPATTTIPATTAVPEVPPSTPARAAAPAAAAVAETTTTVPAPTTTVSPYLALRVPVREDPLRVWVGGDSLAVGLGWSLSRLSADTGLLTASEAGHISSSLARPDYYDWPGEIQRVVAEEAPEVMVVMLGANDAQAMQTESGLLTFGTPEWEAEYRARVQAIMALASDGRRLIWVGEPVVRDGNLDAKMQVIDRIQREEAANFLNVTFVDGRTFFSTAEGGYTDRLPASDGGEQFVAGGDGVHPNTAGYDRLAALVAAEVTRLFDPGQAALPAPPAEPGAPPPPVTLGV